MPTQPHLSTPIAAQQAESRTRHAQGWDLADRRGGTRPSIL